MSVNDSILDEGEMKELSLMSLRKEKEKLVSILTEKTDDELLSIFDYIIENPFSHRLTTEYIVERLYCDDIHFVDLLLRLIESVSSDMACGNIIGPIEEIALKDPEITISISEKMKNMGVRPGICSGFVISSLLGKGIIDEEAIRSLESSDNLTKRKYLVGLCNSFIRRDEDTARLYIPKLLEIAESVDNEDADILIHTLLTASRFDKENIFPIIETVIDNRGHIAALVFVNATLYREDKPMKLFKKAVQIIESEEIKGDILDRAYGNIYESDSDFVIERLRTRLDGEGYPLAGMWLEHSIKKNPTPVIELLEAKIDEENPTMMQVGASIIGDLLPATDGWLKWCQKWKDDEKKERVVLKLLAKILSESRGKKSDDVSKGAIDLAKEFAQREKVDYEFETKGISLKPEEKDLEDVIKALHVVNLIRNPPIAIDADALERVLKNYPYVCKAIGDKWLVKNAASKKPHYLAYIFSQELDEVWMKELEQKYEAETDELKKAIIADIYRHQPQKIQCQDYWEMVFKTLDEYKLQIPLRKLRNPDTDESILAEAEVIARLAPHFNIELEPDIEQLRPKRLDALIEYGGQSALIEIASVERKLEHQEVATHSVVSSIPGDKIKNVLLYKFQRQLKEGKNNPELPIILILNISAFAGPFMDIENAIYGQFQFSYKMDTETHARVEEGTSRAYENAFYREENSDIVTAIAGYERDYTKNDSLIGRLYLPLASQPPKNPISKEFRIKLRDALFGESENSSWETLKKIEGIDEALALKFYANGIEDIGVLASAEGDELSVDGLEHEQLVEFQQEARRVVALLRTKSVRYLNGIDQDTFDILQNKGVFLINDLLKLNEPPEGVSTAIWETMVEDARNLLGKINTTDDIS